MNNRLIILGGDRTSTRIVYNYLSNYFNIELVIIEEPLSQKKVLKKRVHKLGFWTILGQILFRCSVVPFLNYKSKRREINIKEHYNLDTLDIPGEKVQNVTSVNGVETMKILSNKKPDLIVINGTRIISKELLNLISVPFLNIHAGITPKYRGVHGMYWALVNRDAENAGVTVHFVDKGIDTGGIISQKKVLLSPDDNFVTYPLLQLAEGVDMLVQAINKCFDGTIVPIKNNLDSRLWYHPTIWQYIYYRLKRGIK